MMRSRNCVRCSAAFNYEISRGNDRKYCTAKCRRAEIASTRKALVSELRCHVDDCDKSPRNVGSPCCEMHYYRLRRNGNLEAPGRPIAGKYEQSAGYIKIYAPGHPMAIRSNYAYEHRKIFYDANGEGPFSCHVCGKKIGYDVLHVDHLDDNHRNNAASNLAPACPTCNRQRGAHKMIKSMTELYGIEAFGVRRTLNEWSRQSAVPRTTLSRRLKDGWHIERALTTPSGPTGCKTRNARMARR